MRKTKIIATVTLCTLAFGVFAGTPIPNNVNHNINVENVKNTTPLCIAIAKGDIDGVKKLLELGVNINEKSNGMKPIHFAARYNQVEIMKVLVDAGASVKSLCDKGYSVVKHAELSNAQAVVAYLEHLG